MENINELIIQYIPKSTLFSNVSHQQINKIINIINTIPREKLKFSNSKWVLFWKDLVNLHLLFESEAYRNTHHLLKITSISTLFYQNPCTIQIIVLPLQSQNPQAS